MPSIKPDGSVSSVPQSDSNGLVAQCVRLPPLSIHNPIPFAITTAFLLGFTIASLFVRDVARRYRAGNALNTAVLINKPPKWSDALGAYVPSRPAPLPALSVAPSFEKNIAFVCLLPLTAAPAVTA
jgi:hypothetical protein